MSSQTEVVMPTLVARSVVITSDNVDILDRRIYPFATEWVRCRSYLDVAVAIEQMVTQSSGPYFAAAGGMVLAAREATSTVAVADWAAFMEMAGARLVATRPTNNGIRVVVSRLLAAGRTAIADNEDLAQMVELAAEREGERYMARSRALGEVASALVPDGSTMLTHCWADAYLIETVAAVLRSGKSIKAICTETRPYLQGARLTAESLAEMGIDTRVITDGMPASVLSQGMADLVITGADRVTMDGHVVNKVGTLQIALAAHAFGVPFYALVHAPDPEAPTAADVTMEERNGEEVLHCLGQRTASTRVRGYYPAFDITPPKYVSAVVTDRGAFSPYDLHRYPVGSTDTSEPMKPPVVTT